MEYQKIYKLSHYSTISSIVSKKWIEVKNSFNSQYSMIKT